MFCSNCGKSLPDHSLFCAFCGTNLSAWQVPPAAAPYQTAPQNQQAPWQNQPYPTAPVQGQEKVGYAGVIIGGIAGAIGAAAIAAAILFGMPLLRERQNASIEKQYEMSGTESGEAAGRFPIPGLGRSVTAD